MRKTLAFAVLVGVGTCGARASAGDELPTPAPAPAATGSPAGCQPLRDKRAQLETKIANKEEEVKRKTKQSLPLPKRPAEEIQQEITSLKAAQASLTAGIKRYDALQKPLLALIETGRYCPNCNNDEWQLKWEDDETLDAHIQALKKALPDLKSEVRDPAYRQREKEKFSQIRKGMETDLKSVGEQLIACELQALVAERDNLDAEIKKAGCGPKATVPAGTLRPKAVEMLKDDKYKPLFETEDGTKDGKRVLHDVKHKDGSVTKEPRLLETYCSEFVDDFASQVFGYEGFNGRSANSIIEKMRRQELEDDGWVKLPSEGGGLTEALAEAHKLAEQGYLVVVGAQETPNGHVAIVMPGAMKGGWGDTEDVPPIAQAGKSVFPPAPAGQDDERLSWGFGKDMKDDIEIYVRKP